MRRWLSLLILVAACGKTGTETQTLPAYLAGDSCRDHVDSDSCRADGACQWLTLDIPCRPGARCLGRIDVCQAKDPCALHADATSCAADASCMWAGAIAGLCPPGASCAAGGGFCTLRPADGCACACPLYCPAGADCPPCSCDCTSGGGTCACACPVCPPNAVCPACDGCDCQPPPEACGGGASTCTCACPACAPGETCPPCSCDCGESAPAPSSCTTSCPTCTPGEDCPPCTSSCAAAPDAGTDPCAAHTDQASCLADTADGCAWAAILAPCREGEPCPSGSCYAQPSDACVCNCPECPAGADCACACDCPPAATCPEDGGTPTPATP